MASDEPLDYANNAHWLLPSSSSGCSYRADGSALVSDAKSPSLTSSSSSSSSSSTGPLYSLYETSATRSVQNHQQQQQQQQQQQEEEEDVDRGGHGSDHVAYYDAASLYPSSGERQQQQQKNINDFFLFFFFVDLTRGGAGRGKVKRETGDSKIAKRKGREGRERGALEKKTKAPAPARRGWGPPFGGAPWGRYCETAT